MATYKASVSSPRPADQVFEFLSDLTNLEQWDPGVVSSRQTEGDSPAVGASYRVKIDTGGRQMDLTYVITEMAGRSLVARAGNWWMSSRDTIEVDPTVSGCVATYSAELKMPFPLSLGDGLLQKKLDQLGDKAVDGLTKVLAGERVG